jgi:hypothetical protein
MITQNRRLVGILTCAGALLFIPLIAMRFTTEVNWTPMDFVVMGAMLLMTGLGVEVALRIARVTWVKVAAVAAILFGFVMVWGTLVHLGG